VRLEAGIAEAVDDRIAAVPAEVLGAALDDRSRLPALALGEIEELLDLPDRLRVVALRDEVDDAHLLHDEPVQDAVGHRIGRQRILVLLVLAQFRAKQRFSN
jgi:hypothetical protein